MGYGDLMVSHKLTAVQNSEKLLFCKSNRSRPLEALQLAVPWFKIAARLSTIVVEAATLF